MTYIFAVLYTLLRLYEVILLARVLSSWLRLDPYHPIMRFLYNLTEPILQPIRAVLPPVGMMDFSPVVAFFLIVAFEQVLRILAAGL